MTVSIEEQGEKGRNWTNSPEKAADQGGGLQPKRRLGVADRLFFGRVRARAVERWLWEEQVRHGLPTTGKRARRRR